MQLCGGAGLLTLGVGTWNRVKPGPTLVELTVGEINTFTSNGEIIATLTPALLDPRPGLTHYGLYPTPLRDPRIWALQDPKEHQRQLKRKQKNRAAAQRCRQRHTDKADTLHQQHESLEKHNHALQKEIQALQAELAWWSRTLHVHEHLCPMAPASRSAPGPPGWGQSKQPPTPGLHGLCDCVEQPGLFQTPASSPLTQQLSPCPQPHDPAGLLPSPLPSPSLGCTVVTAPPTQPSPSPVLPPSSTGPSLLGTSSDLSTLLPSPLAQTAPPQLLGLEHVAVGKLGPLPPSPSAFLGLAHLQSGKHKPVPASWVADWQGPGADPSPHPLLAFPLLSPAHVHF